MTAKRRSGQALDVHTPTELERGDSRAHLRRTASDPSNLAEFKNPASLASRSTVEARMTVPIAAEGRSARLFGRQTVVLTA
jgi:hypothetical protein